MGIIDGKEVYVRLQITCHYMKSGQSACMFRISYGFQCRQDRRYIAETCNSALKIGLNDITSFLSLQILPISWRYQRFCREFIHVIFADSSKGVCPVITSVQLRIL